jgi:hypothetical protein
VAWMSATITIAEPMAIISLLGTRFAFSSAL